MTIYPSHSTDEKVKAAIKAAKFQTGKTYTADAMTKALTMFDQDMRKDKDTAKVWARRGISLVGEEMTIP